MTKPSCPCRLEKRDYHLGWPKGKSIPFAVKAWMGWGIPNLKEIAPAISEILAPKV